VAARKAQRRMARENKNREPGRREASLEGQSQGSTDGSIQDPEELHPGHEALKRTRSGRWNATKEPQEGRGRETGTHPDEGKLRRENLASAAEGFASFREARLGANRRRGAQTPRAELGADAQRAEAARPAHVAGAAKWEPQGSRWLSRLTPGTDRAACAVETQDLERASRE
jgi:hypothetical protein